MKHVPLAADKKRYLVHIYLTQGYQAAKPIAIQYGIKPHSITNYTRRMGIKGKRGREPGKWKGITGKTDNSPRWQTAIERGAVLA